MYLQRVFNPSSRLRWVFKLAHLCERPGLTLIYIPVSFKTLAGSQAGFHVGGRGTRQARAGALSDARMDRCLFVCVVWLIWPLGEVRALFRLFSYLCRGLMRVLKGRATSLIHQTCPYAQARRLTVVVRFPQC